MDQKLGFCAAEDGVRICYATVGEGPPLVQAPNWLSHLEFEWQSLITSGKTDWEIAQELSIRVGTVSTHVRNPLNQTGAANRASAYAAHHNLA